MIDATHTLRLHSWEHILKKHSSYLMGSGDTFVKTDYGWSSHIDKLLDNTRQVLAKPGPRYDTWIIDVEGMKTTIVHSLVASVSPLPKKAEEKVSSPRGKISRILVKGG